MIDVNDVCGLIATTRNQMFLYTLREAIDTRLTDLGFPLRPTTPTHYERPTAHGSADQVRAEIKRAYHPEEVAAAISAAEVVAQTKPKGKDDKDEAEAAPAQDEPPIMVSALECVEEAVQKQEATDQQVAQVAVWHLQDSPKKSLCGNLKADGTEGLTEDVGGITCRACFDKLNAKNVALLAETEPRAKKSK